MQTNEFETSVYDAAGQMVSSVTTDNFASRFYDGNGREIKRQSFSRVETAELSYWEFREIKYYVRSSVLGGEVVSEVNGTGEKELGQACDIAILGLF